MSNSLQMMNIYHYLCGFTIISRELYTNISKELYTWKIISKCTTEELHTCDNNSFPLERQWKKTIYENAKDITFARISFNEK